MVTAHEETDAFAAARSSSEEMLCWLEGTESAGMTHAELEDQVGRRGREVQRLMLQDHLDLRALREERVRVVDSEGIVHRNVEPAHGRYLSTVVGTVNVSRLAYRHLGASNLHPADAALNLPTELHSHGLRRLAAIESTRGSFEDASAAIERSTGVAVAKRQVESLTAAAATDVEDFYAERAPEPDASTEVMVISVDGKGIVMRPDALRDATAKAAAGATRKLETRLSKGEKRYRKRMAEVGAVYDLEPVPRSAADVLASKHDAGASAPPAPKAWRSPLRPDTPNHHGWGEDGGMTKSTSTRRYSEEFKRDAVALATSSGRPVKEVASELGISDVPLATWVKKERQREAATDDEDAKEAARLRKRRGNSRRRSRS